MNRAIHFKIGTDIDDGPHLRTNHQMTPEWAFPWSCGPISKFWDPYNFKTNRAIHFKFGTEMEDGPLLHMNRKITQVGVAMVT